MNHLKKGRRRGAPPANPLGSADGVALGSMAASLEQSVPLTEGGRELGRKAKVGERPAF